VVGQKNHPLGAGKSKRVSSQLPHRQYRSKVSRQEIQKKLMPADISSQGRRRNGPAAFGAAGFDACFSGPIAL